MTTTGIFPTFEEIDNGKRSFTEHYYRNVGGKKVRSEKLKQSVLITDLDAMKIIEISILRNRNKKRIYFEYTLFGRHNNTTYQYNEQGWGLCVADIKTDLAKMRKHIERIMNENH